MKCKGTFHSRDECCNKDWIIEHENECSQLYSAVCKNNLINKTETSPPLKAFEELKRECKNDNDDVSDNKSNAPPPKHLKNYPSQKSRLDLKFELFDSQLNRLQQRCSCRFCVELSGACAHA